MNEIFTTRTYNGTGNTDVKSKYTDDNRHFLALRHVYPLLKYYTGVAKWPAQLDHSKIKYTMQYTVLEKAFSPPGTGFFRQNFPNIEEEFY